MGRAPCCDKEARVKRGPWTPDEDQKLVAYIREHGHGSWRALPQKAGLARCGKSCRLRWTNYLRPDIKRGRFSHEEEQTIFQLHAILGNRWSAIASRLPRRTDNEIKNYWNTHLKKRLLTTTQGGMIGPLQALLSSPWTPLIPTRLTHMTQWDLTLADAQARLRPKPAETQDHGVHPSALFMRAWKTEAESSLLGTVKLEPTHIGPGMVLGALRSVGTVPGTPDGDGLYPSSVFEVLDHVASSGTGLGASGVGSAPMTEDSEEGHSGTSVLDGSATVIGDESGTRSGSVFGDQFSPTSIWRGPESHADVHSPCCSTNSGTTSDCFDLILYQSSSYHKFPVILEQPEPNPSCSSGDTFWEQQQAELMGALHPEDSLVLADAGSESGLESIMPLDFDEVEFPQLEPLCPEAGQLQTD